MDDLENAQGADNATIEVATPEEAAALLHRVAAAMREIEEAKHERTTEPVRAARAQLAALHGVARLRKRIEG
jgi:hypothetical protein